MFDSLSCGSAGSTVLQTTLLLQEDMCVKAEILEKLKEQQNITEFHRLDGQSGTFCVHLQRSLLSQTDCSAGL